MEKIKKNLKSTTTLFRHHEGIDFNLYIPLKRDKDNKIEIQYNYLNPATNKNKQLKMSTGIDRYCTDIKKTKQQATDLVQTIIELLDQGYNPIDKSFPTYRKLNKKSKIPDCMKQWLISRDSDREAIIISQGEYDSTADVLSEYEKYLKRNNLLFETVEYFTTSDIDSFMRYFKKKRKFAETSYNAYFYKLQLFYKFLVRERVITHNPCTDAFRYKVKGVSRFKVFSDVDLENVKEKMKGDANFLNLLIATTFLYSFRIRPIEQIRIKLGMINFETGLLTLPAKSDTVVDGISRRTTKNGDAERFELTEDLMMLIKKYVGDITNKDFFLFGSHGKPKPKQVAESYFGTTRWEKFKKVYDLPKGLLFYALKHTSNTNEVEMYGIDALQEINRHASQNQTRAYITKSAKKIIKIREGTQF